MFGRIVGIMSISSTHEKGKEIVAKGGERVREGAREKKRCETGEREIIKEGVKYE